MTRKQNDVDGSLELLLDTICNTFGGVLFISILVVLLLNMSSKQAETTPPSETAQAELIKAQVRLAQTNGDLEKLQTAMNAQSQIAEQIVDPELSGLVRTFSKLQQGIAERTERKVQGIDEMAQNQIEINQKTQQIREYEQSLRNAQASLAGIERRLVQEIESRTQAAKLPKGRETRKSEIPMFLKGGRLCSYVKREGNRLVENLAEIAKKQDEENRPYIEPKPGTGILIDLDGDHAELDDLLGDLESGEHYLAIFVWPDSFPHFAVVKDQMVAQQFEYRLVPFPQDQKIYMGASEDPVQVQ